MWEKIGLIIKTHLTLTGQHSPIPLEPAPTPSGSPISPCATQKSPASWKQWRRVSSKGCPNLSEELVTEYLNPSPATTKGHMKRPKKGIRSTRTKQLPTVMWQPAGTSIPQQPIAQANPPILSLFNDVSPYPGPAYQATNGPNIIANDESITNVFCFGAFADKITGVVYKYVHHNFVENFPDYVHFASPMVHPTTGETITSYKRLMHNPATVEVWQTAFGKDVGGMAQGNDKMGQKETNSIFVMTHAEIKKQMQIKWPSLTPRMW
jgi:hypothetical protein